MNDPIIFVVFRTSLIAIELAIFSLLFLTTMKKKKHWIIGVISTVIIVGGIVVGVSFATGYLYSYTRYDRNVTSIFGALLQLLILLLLGFGFYFCFDVSLYELGSVISLGYATRWVIFCLYSLIFNFANPELILVRFNQQTPLNIIIYLAVYIPYIVFTAFMIRRFKKINIP